LAETSLILEEMSVGDYLIKLGVGDHFKSVPHLPLTIFLFSKVLPTHPSLIVLFSDVLPTTHKVPNLSLFFLTQNKTWIEISSNGLRSIAVQQYLLMQRLKVVK
jgi:hypothetical protein